jgi:thiol:disulfide interchange protein DsbD
MRSIAATVFALGLAVCAGAAGAQVVRAPHVTAGLVAQSQGAAPGSTLYAAVVLTADKGWHTYWRNPGDAGEATTIAWTLPVGWRAGDIVWPTPRRLPVGPIMNFGYEGQTLLPVPIQIPATAHPGETGQLKARVDYLVCAEVCVPGSADLDLALPIVGGSPTADPHWGAAIEGALAEAPKPASLTATYQFAAGRLTLAVAGAALTGASPTDVYFYPYAETAIDHGKPQTVERGGRGLTLGLTAGSAFTAPATPPTAISGVLAVDGKAYEITAAPGRAPAGASGLGPLGRTSGGPPGGRFALPAAMGLAFLGGLILNLMPCVFPILSMKAAALARHASGGGAKAQGLAFLAGVLITFGVLAGVLIAARAAGEAIGWGFQLQSPTVTAALSLIMLAAALNLSGLFEVGASLQGLGSGVSAHGETLGSVLTGALAVVVAAPCTAPFMGPALGYALTQPPAAALTVFLGLGLGFAAPFVLIAFSPALLRRLPRPGAWMATFKAVLAFPMFAAAAWLLWVVAQQTDPAGLARLLAAMVILGFAAWLFGRAQRRAAEGRKGGAFLALSGLGLAASLAAIAAGPFAGPVRADVSTQATAGGLEGAAYSPERLADLRAAGKPVLINFTAAWCVTCQVNERIAFSSAEVRQALRRSGATYLVGDWTNHNEAIAQALKAQDRIGVPLYLVYAPGASEPRVLPQLLTPAILVEALDAASARPAKGL